MRYITLILVVFYGFSIKAQDYFPKNDGVWQTFKNEVAVTNATIYIASNQKIEKGTLLIKDGKISAIGTNVNIPKNATLIDASGKTIYPSFIDIFTEFGIDKPQQQFRASGNFMPQYHSSRDGYYWNDHIKSDYNAFENCTYDEKTSQSFREAGFGSVISHYNDGIIAGTGMLWTLNDKENNATRILQNKITHHLTFSRNRNSRQSYPSSLMGSMALIRQFYHDAAWYENGGSKTKDLSIESYLANKKLVQIFNAGDKLNSLRASKIAAEFGINYLIKGAGNEFERIAEIKKTNATYIIPLNFPDAYDVSDPYLAQQINLSDLRFWNQAPYNVKILAENQIPFVLTTYDSKSPKEFLMQLRKVVSLGLPKEKALAALTETPAKLINQVGLLGTLQNGSWANFIITSGDVFESETTIYENWVQGSRHILEKMNQKDIRGTYELTIQNEKYNLEIKGSTSKPESKITKDSLQLGSKVQFQEPWLQIIIKDKDTTSSKFIRLTGIANDSKLEGKAVLSQGEETTWFATKKSSFSSDVDSNNNSQKNESNDTFLPVTFPNIAYGTTEKHKAETLLIKNATVWTGEKEGILKETDVLISNGKIIKIGKNIDEPKAKKIDATGKHLTAGIIDEHSHIAISRGVNESGQNSTAEVTIEDVVNSEDINIYRNLSGGVTSANLLHGSANPIGGRAAFIKLKWGYAPDEMLVHDAPKYIKFALGENVKQSNWGDAERVRFPQTRMGVEQVYEDYFSRAIAYQAAWDTYKKARGKNIKKPRYDIELEVLSEILNKKRFITCHSYVQSEINMLMKVAEKYQFKIQTFTHILEGYKLADKMAKHGVAGSTFADWWAYKYEVKDAIPHNAALMNELGVKVSINSDDAEMSRRLNQEAAKTMKYGNVSEEDAWNFVTLNPAKILQVDDRVGSIKVGKDADVVLWTAHPLSIYTKAEKTIVDGIIFYDLEQENKILDTIQKERAWLINAMLDAKNKGMKTQLPKKKETNHYHCDTLGEACQIIHAKRN